MVGFFVGPRVGCSVCLSVLDILGFCDRCELGAELGAELGTKLETELETELGAELGPELGPELGTALVDGSSEACKVG